MGILSDDAQIIKGKLQGVKGGIQQASGDELGGLVEKAKGKANQVVGNIKKNINSNSTYKDQENTW